MSGLSEGLRTSLRTWRTTVGWTRTALLADKIRRMADAGSRKRLHSASAVALVTSATVHITIGDRGFLVTCSSGMKSFPVPTAGDVIVVATSFSDSVSTLKTELSLRSYGPDCAFDRGPNSDGQISNPGRIFACPRDAPTDVPES